MKYTHSTRLVCYPGRLTTIAILVALSITRSDVVGAVTIAGGTTTVVNGAGELPALNETAIYVNGTMNILNGGTVNSNADSSVGYDFGSSGTVDISGVGSAWNNSSDFYVGYYGEGSLTIRNGATVNNTSSSIGFDEDSSGSVTLTGASSVWNNRNRLIVGDSGEGHLKITDGATVNNTNGYIRNYLTGASATVDVTGAGTSWNNSNYLYVGFSGEGRLSISDGATVSNTVGYVGFGDSLSATSVVDVTGAGSVWNNSVRLFVGYWGQGQLNISDGATVNSEGGSIGYWKKNTLNTVNVTGAGSAWNNSTGELSVGHYGNGRLTISDNGTVSVPLITIAAYEGSSGVLNIGAAQGEPATVAGMLLTDTVFLGSGNSTLVLNHTNSDYLFDAKITGTNASSIVRVLSGTTILTGISTYAGQTDVTGGTLQAGVENTLSARSAYTISPAGVLNLNGYSNQVASMNNAGLVRLSSDASASAVGATLTVMGDYAGNDSTLALRTVLGDDDSVTDHMVVKGSTSGNTTVQILNAGGSGALTTNGIELITVGGASDGEFKQDGRIVAGAYDYNLLRGNGQNASNWYLSSTLAPVVPGEPIPVEPIPVEPTPVEPTPVEPIPVEPTPVEPIPVEPTPTEPTPTEPTPVEPTPAKPTPVEPMPVQPIPVEPTPVKPTSQPAPLVRPEAGLYGMNLYAANTMFTHRLHDRLGETHYVDTLTGKTAVTSLWMRNIGGHTRSYDGSGQLDMQSNRYVLQLGGDIAQWSSSEHDHFHLGVMAGYARQKSRSHSHVTDYRANASIDGYSVGVYGTWLQDNYTSEGAYVDTWALYNWFDNTVSGESISTEKYKSSGFTGSVEAGYTWKLADISERNTLYIQPKAQATWMGVKADSHTETNGTQVEGIGDNNLQTRLGLRLYGHGHNKIDDGKSRTFQPFVEANWVHNTKNFGATLNGEHVEMAGTRNIGEVKFGVEGQITPRLAAWGNIAQQLGGRGYSDTQGIAGIKYNW
ncbi:autotransporter outer membrane beta-barrel domain-containing protein [Enterobacter cloacae]|uniref:autotransporter outer membrane beta-barrel domain-containing protein n=1 Tax=Enterobacter cloacae TaxID=550 RepID=UPI0013E31F0E|nr:autotransporter outer membrane beta-barrel domain-containing protein [Enterobacter cloacae]UER85383.1 autotransporter outer membrane beta-barrel domain-containing protein [Enterobacter cloacae]HBC0587964.1 autotransporter outer membrane beta-barrel domain-containing protein [Enterobacter cloacae]